MKEFIKEQERSKKYGCNGKCYDCLGIDICPETRVMEFIGTVVAVLMLTLFPIAMIVAIILMIL